MTGRRRTTHRSNSDDKPKRVTGVATGDGPARAEEGRENESFAKETDSAEAHEPVDPVTDTVPGTDEEPSR
ncbi:hypothetical protein [Arthrobacter oryzae]|uniref:hypothetical protein n=1 Tax=Arthrobacter oryzae TaxID=409290 RepID=UPI0028646EF3|nr:hypothetical protein [Arthrobacter oryzae]MDR6508979.1 hypothetical protein [Arthrobacter oryzae]